MTLRFLNGGLDALSRVMLQTKQWEKAIEYMERIISGTETFNRERPSQAVLREFAERCRDAGDLYKDVEVKTGSNRHNASARHYYSRAVELFKEAGDPESAAETARNLQD